MLTLKNEPPDIDTVATVSNQYSNYGHKFRKFTRSCLVKDPAQRPTARELLNHTFIKAKAKVTILTFLDKAHGDVACLPCLFVTLVLSIFCNNNKNN